MRNPKRTARFVGILILVSYISLVIGQAILGDVVDTSSDLAAIFSEKSQVITGSLFEFINDAVVIGIAVLLFPFLRKHSEGIALWYIGLRTIEAIMYTVGRASRLSLIDLSENFVAAGAPEASFYQEAHAVALSQEYWAGQMATVAFILGATALYYLLFRTELVPRFISIWGFAAVASLIAANLFGVPDLTQGFEVGMLLYFPIVANELFLAIWLLVKGFKDSALDALAEIPGWDDPAVRDALHASVTTPAQ